MAKAKRKSGVAGVFIRCSAEDVARLDAIVAQVPITTRANLTKELMRIGLDLVEEDLTRLIRGRTSKKGGPPPGRKG